MWLQRLTSYLLRHSWQTMALTFIITFIPIIGIVGILIAAFITLSKSIVEGAILTVLASLPYVISFYFTSTETNVLPLVLMAAVGVAVLSNILTWIFAVMLQRKSSFSLIIQIAALIGVLTISVIHLMYPEVADWWGNQLQIYYDQAQAFSSDMLKTTPAALSKEKETISFTKQYATGLMTAAILFNSIMQLIVARWWQAIIFKPGLLRNELHTIRLTQLAGVLFTFSLVLSYLGNRVVLDIMPILYLLFAGAGLSLVHYLLGLKETKNAWVWILVLYVALLLSMPLSILLVALFGLADIWLNFRQRFKKI